MSKRLARKRKTQQFKKSKPKKKRKVALIICAVLVLAFAAVAVGHWKRLPGFSKPVASVPPAPSGFSPNSPSKEYIYAGGRLIATEEPAGSSSLAAPTSFSATTASNSQINLTWTAPAGSVAHYIVERSQSLNAAFTPLSPNPTTNSFTDSTVTSGVAYLYRVRAVDSLGLTTAASNLDVATAVSFTDDPLIADSTIIKAQHLIELRQAVNAVRLLAGLQAASWTDASPQGVFIKKAHVEELRTKLDEALTALGLSTQAYTDPVLTTNTSIRKVHFDELRQRVK
ncbi:MAG TPA: fibronectin type III domain-containing protein [Pyrinomonadaceae bacterium]|nr:fibronectin type III domain-containing protein [Pyrinomonadaceae bacterium]